MPYRILIVEDETLLALDIALALEDAGYELGGTAKDMHEALHHGARGGIDLATMDVQLAGGTNGVETASRLWTQFGIRSLFVSGSLDEEVRLDASSAQPVGFISKPADTDQLIAIMKAHFDRAT